MSKRENHAAAAEFRELAGVDFDEFTRRAPIKLLLAIGRYAAPTDTAVQFADETHPLFQQQRARWSAPCGTPGRSAGRVPATDCRSSEALLGLSAYMQLVGAQYPTYKGGSIGLTR